MIEILSASGEVLLEVPILSDAVSHEELMGQDFVRLSWSSDKGDVIPAGAYIRHNGENYSLLEPYTPEMVSEGEFRYRPEFHSRVDAWDKHPACVYSYDEESNVESKEFDWTFVGSPADAMYIVAQSILGETGEEWSVEISDSLPATIELTCQANSIKSILSAIAERCETDWWVDKSTNTLYLSNCSRGEAIPLSIGKEVGVPSISAPNDGYYTRYYAFGSTRNISQDSNDGSYVANKRLTLDPAVYPNGYKDVKGHFESGVFVSDLHPSEVFSKVLIFDDIYPSSPLIISNVRARLKYRVKDGGEKIVIGGTKEDPIYDQYAIWYFKIDGFSFDKDSIIKGQELSVHFNDGRLAGHDFKLAYHDKEEIVFKEGDVAKFKIEKGDYEILFVQEGSMIIPDLAYIVPSDGDSITLYNIEMPSEYTASAMADLEAAVDKKIAEDSADQNTYEFNSNPVAFHEQEIDLSLGQNVALISGDKTTESRVTMIEKHLDFSFEQKIRIGQKVAKSTTTQLKEGLTSVNYNLNVIETFNKLSESIYESHVRTQAQINEALLKLSDMFYWHDDAKTTIATKYPLFSEKTIASGGKGEDGQGGGGDSGFVVMENWDEYNHTLPQVLGAILGIELHNRLTALEGGSADSPYATIAFVEQTISDLIGGADSAYDTLLEIQQILQGNEASIGTILDEIAKKASKDELEEVSDKVDDLDNRISDLEEKSDMFHFVTDADGTTRIETEYPLSSTKTIASGGVGQHGTNTGAGSVMAIEVNGEIYDDSDSDGVIVLPNYPTRAEYNSEMTLINGRFAALDAKDESHDISIGEHSIRISTNENDIVVLKQTDEDFEKRLQRAEKITNYFDIDNDDNVYTWHNLYSTKTIASGGVGEEGDSGIDTSEFVTWDSFDDQLVRINGEMDGLAGTISDIEGTYVILENSISDLGGRIDNIDEWIANAEENGIGGGSVVYYTGLTDGLRIGAITIDEVSTDVFIPANLSEYTIDSDFVNALSVEGFITEVDANNKYALQSALDDFLPKDAEASSAARLSDEDEYTAFGRTFFSNGKPVNITSSPIAPANGGLYAYDYDNDRVLLFYYANGGDFSELRIGSEPASREENVRICGYPLIMHHGSVNTGGVVAKTTVDGIVVPAGRKLYLGDDNGYHITMEYDEVTDAIRIDGNVYVTGTVASGGKAEEGDSPLADLEERVSRLENLIS